MAFGRALAQPVADFSPTPSEGCSPLIVKFLNKSTKAVSYSWDFGNGNIRQVQDLLEGRNHTHT